MAHPTDRSPKVPGRLLAAAGVRLRVAVASIAVLAAGSALAPREATPPSRTEERANPLIEEQVTVAAPSVAPFGGVQDAARLPRAHVVEILPARPTRRNETGIDSGPPGPTPLRGAGVFVSDGHVLTHASALDGRLAVRIVAADGRTADAVVSAFDAASRLVLLRTTPGLAPPAVIASAPPVAGDFCLAAGHVGGRAIALPAFIASASDRSVVVTAAGPGTAPGLPVFTLGGALVGVLGAPASGDVTLATRVVDLLIAQAAAGEVPRSLGITVQRLDGGLAQAFGPRGVLVASVVPGGPTAAAGLVAGDVLIGVDEADVGSPEDARQKLTAAAAASSTTLRLLRRNREVAVTVTATSSYALAHLNSLAAAGNSAPRAGAVLPVALVTALGLTDESRVLSINGSVVDTPAQAARALSARRPVDVLHLREAGSAYFVAVERVR